jgi:AcrR family transcriptional regulator
MTHAAVQRVREGLESGELRSRDLTARSLAHYLGATTSLLYHHWGSLEGFLQEVSRAAFDSFEGSLMAFESRPPTRATFEAFANNYLSFACEHPALYELMFERDFDWRRNDDEDRRTAPGRVTRALVRQFTRAGSFRPKLDAKLFHASLHGLASLARGRQDARQARHEALGASRRLISGMLAGHPRARVA